MDTNRHDRLAELPRRYVRSVDADEIARILDGTDYAEPEVVRRQRDFAERRAAVALHKQVAAIVFWTAVAVLLVGLAAWALPS